MSHLLSVVTICYNDLTGLRKTIDSLRDQSSYDFEQWVIDGDSRDGTREYLESLRVPWQLHWISEKDKGIYDAMNKGTARISGRYVWYLNSGDYACDPHVVADILQAIEKNRDADLIYGKVFFESEFGRRPVGRPVTAEDFVASMPIAHPSLLFRRELVKERPYPTDYRIISDWIVIRSFFEEKRHSVFIDRPLVVFNLEGISSTNHWKDLREKLRYEKNLLRRLEIAAKCGGKYGLIWVAKKLGIYSVLKKRQHHS
jgi:putative colanic acid biosynthesis glycosyltransferase